jgi:hypothetical protein
MINNLISGKQYIFTRKRPNEDNTETFYATFYDIISATLRVTDVYDQSMNLQCDMRTLPVEWIVSIDPFDNPTIQTLNNQYNSTELDDDIETIVLDDVKSINKKTPQCKDAFY